MPKTAQHCFFAGGRISRNSLNTERTLDMASVSLSLAELRKLPDENAAKQAREFAAGRHQLNGEAADLEAKIRALEQIYETPSSELRNRLADGSMKETLEVCQWLMLLKIRDRLDSSAKR